MKYMPYVIGLTGNIGTGKSTILQMLAELGARVMDADQLSRMVMQPGGLAYEKVVRSFGSSILAEDGQIDRGRLGQIVFDDNQALRQLESIVHPAVYVRAKEQIDAAQEPVVVLEAIKLLESGLTLGLCDAVWVVTAKPEMALTRLMAQRGMDEAEARRRLAHQMPEGEKVTQADVVIDNSGDPEETRAQVLAAWQNLMAVLETGKKKREEVT